VLAAALATLATSMLVAAVVVLLLGITTSQSQQGLLTLSWSGRVVLARLTQKAMLEEIALFLLALCVLTAEALVAVLGQEVPHLVATVAAMAAMEKSVILTAPAGVQEDIQGLVVKVQRALRHRQQERAALAVVVGPVTLLIMKTALYILIMAAAAVVLDF
jgi:hypothetical protein